MSDDTKWCLLDLLMRARQKGVHRLNRLELINSTALPQGVTVKLVWAALTLSPEFVTWHGQHDFSITERGIAEFEFKFGKRYEPATPTHVADAVICLPGPEHYRN